MSWVFVLSLNGLLPGMVGGQTTYQSSVGIIECGKREPLNVARGRCSFMGGNSKSVIPQELPFVFLASLLSILFFLPADVSFYVVSALTVLFAIIWGRKFFNLATKSRYIALFGIDLFLVSPFILGLRNFGGTYWSFLVVPAILYLGLKIINFFPKLNDKTFILRTSKVVLLWTGLLTTLIFLDGYGFFICSLTILILHLSIYKKTKDSLYDMIRQLLMFGTGFILSSYIYKLFIPTENFGKSPLDLFRAMGVDPVTIFLPTKNSFVASVVNHGFNWSHLWGDGSNTNNYLGIFLIIIFIFGAIFVINNKKLKIVNLHLAMLLVFFIGLILSFGPSIKFNSQIKAMSNGNISERYMMSSKDAVIGLPTALLYRYAPGFSYTRASYRWFVVSEVAVIYFAVYYIDILYRRRKFIPVTIIVVLILVDILPNPQPLFKANTLRYKQISQFNDEVVDKLEPLISKNDLALFYPNAVGGNDFLANYIAPTAGLKTYNVGGDKAVNIARIHWPSEIRQLLSGSSTERQEIQLLNKLFENKDISVLIIPEFDLRWDSYRWPPTTTYHDTSKLIESLRSNNYKVEKYQRFELVRPVH